MYIVGVEYSRAIQLVFSDEKLEKLTFDLVKNLDSAKSESVEVDSILDYLVKLNPTLRFDWVDPDDQSIVEHPSSSDYVRLRVDVMHYTPVHIH